MEPTAFFDFSLAGESRFSLISCFPSRGKTDFCWFLIFPRGGKPFFAVFWFSLARESRFSLSSDFPPWGKAVFRWVLIFPHEGKPIFAVFCTSYPYEAWFFIFSAHRRGTKPCFMRFSSIVPLRKLHFSVFRWLYPVSEQIFPKIDNLPPYLSYFSWKSMIVPRIWTNFPENW